MTEKISKGDELELNIRIGMRDDGLLIVDFGKPISWFGMTKDQAIQFAKDILKLCVDNYIKVEIPDERTQ